jgi:hypothetical protein
MVGFEWGKEDLSVNGKGNQQQQQHTPHNNGSSGDYQPKVGIVLSVMSISWTASPSESSTAAFAQAV